MVARHVLYLHGFASSANSTKARYLAKRAAVCGARLVCPDFNEPDFASLTISRMIEQVVEAISGLPEGPVSLIGSSLGGLIALQVASTANRSRLCAGRHSVDRLVLLAPAVQFRLKDDPYFGPKVDAWRRTNELEIFHHAYGEPRRLRFDIFEDAERYADSPVEIAAPMLIFQGNGDQTIDPRMVAEFARGRPNTTLRLVDDDHQLLASLDQIWRESSVFLGIECT